MTPGFEPQPRLVAIAFGERGAKRLASRLREFETELGEGGRDPAALEVRVDRHPAVARPGPSV